MKKFLAFLLVAIMAFSLVACSTDADNTAKSGCISASALLFYL